jgi:hypothetical protein
MSGSPRDIDLGVIAGLPQMRSKSHSDIVGLLRRNPEMDVEAIRETCRNYRLRGLGKVLAELGR